MTISNSFRTFFRQSTIILPLAAGVLLLISYLIAMQPFKLVSAAAFAGAVGLTLLRPQALWSALAFGVGLALLPLEGAWSVWMMVAGTTALWMVMRERQMLVLDGGLMLAALIGVLLANSTPLEMAMLGVGILAAGVLVTYIRVEAPITITENSPVHAAESLDLSEFSKQVEFTVDGMVKAAQAIKQMTSQQIVGAADQVDVLHNTNARLDAFLELAERTSQYARTMTRAAQEADEVSQTGEAALQEALTRMNDIRAQVGAIGQTIVKLAQLTRSIDAIITSVSEIAVQSNLLALNASIEAARAGTHGRGFAVVAEEVRSLSRQSTDAARQVRGILVQIQRAVKDTIDATESGTEQVSIGAAITQEADTIMRRLGETVTSSHQTVRVVSDIIRQQTEGMEAISIDMDRMDRITQQTMASTRVVEQVSQNLLRLADELQAAVVSTLPMNGTATIEEAFDTQSTI